MRGACFFAVAVAAMFSSFADLASAQTTSARDLAAIRSNLSSADPSVRVEAMSACVASGSAAAIEMCEDVAIVGDDPTLRTLAVRSAFSRLRRLVIEVSDEALAQPAAQSHTNALSTSIRVYDQATGRFGYGPYNVDSQVSGEVINFTFSNCSGVFRREAGTWTFRGRLTCRFSSWTPQGVITLR